MLKNANRVINITGYDVSDVHAETVFTTSFHCAKCKKLYQCGGAKNCEFIKYIQTRVANATYSYDLPTPTLSILLPNFAACNDAIKTIKRAKRLRTFKPLLRCK